MPQLHLDEGQRLLRLLRLEDTVAQLHGQAPRWPAAAAAHLQGDALPCLARLPSLAGLCLLGVGWVPGVQVRLRRGAQHDLRVDAGGHQCAFQALEDLLANDGNGVIVGPEDKLANNGVLPEDRQVLREERRVQPRGRTVRERGHPLGDRGLLVLQNPDHARRHVADPAAQRLERDGKHQLGTDVLPALMPMNTGAPSTHGVQHQRRQLVRKWVRQAHGDLHLREEPLPRRAAIERHVGTRHPDLRAQVGGVALDAVKVGEEVGHGARGVLRRHGTGATMSLRRRGCKLHKLILEGQSAGRAAGRAVDDVLQGAAKRCARGARAPQHLVGRLPLLDLARLGLRLREPRLQALEASHPLRNPLMAKNRKLLLQ
mmetsp:Transcript_100054/g.265942  ORF Transcript_100054/g.265942 Transcript_100054/m.265942 type:complete len:372 (-) Transcript_100054:224-1339(-)